MRPEAPPPPFVLLSCGVDMGRLAESFSRAWARGPGEPGADEALETALADFCAVGRAAWPDVTLDAEALAAFVGARRPDSDEPLAFLRGLRAGDLYLACACARGDARGLRAFDDAFVSKLPLYLRSLRPAEHLVADTKQRLLEKLFVAEAGKTPKIAQYSGRGALEGWVRVAALRIALNTLETEDSDRTRQRDAEHEVAHRMVPQLNPELELMAESLRAPFVAAFRAAMESLSPRDRSLLRFTYVEQLSDARIADIYSVHRTTALRWREAAEADVLSRTHAALMDRLGLTATDCEALIAMVRSRLQATLRSLLNTAT
jgi:RNA polymerase sigma-70 factor, ECF subfamily